MSKLSEKLTQLEEQTAALVIEAAELRKQLTAPTPKSPLVDRFGRYMSEPEMGAKYYCSDSYGEVWGVCWGNYPSDIKLLDSGAAFDTKESAELQAKRLKLTQAARVFMHKDQLENGVLDYTNASKEKYCLLAVRGAVHNEKSWVVMSFLAFTSREVRAQFRTEFSDFDILMILGVDRE